MKILKLTSFVTLVAVVSLTVTGCGVPNNKYEALVNEKMALEEKLSLLTKSRNVLRSEYEDLLRDKMGLASRVETLTNEKRVLRDEYDELLDEKVSLKAAYDEISALQEIRAAEAEVDKVRGGME